MSAEAVTPPVIDIPFVEQVLAGNPGDAGAWSALGVLLRRAGHNEASLACHYRGLSFDRAHPAVWSNLGNVLTEIGRHDRAVAAHRRALVLGPDNTAYLYNAAIGLRKAGVFRESLAVLDQALRVDPGNPNLLWERALCRLQIGDYPAGFADYEARRFIPSYRNRIPPGPMWDGSPLAGRTLLVTTEQGFGDALLAARYLPMLKGAGGRIVFECHNELRSVLGDIDGVDGYFPAGAPYPPYDAYVSLMSLPRLFGTTAATVPPPIRLHISEEARAKATRLLAGGRNTLKVGIIWSGRVTFADNVRRATSLARFLRFLEIPGITFYSLQKGPPEEQLQALGTGLLVTPLGPHFNDFADTAAVVEQLDLVLMTDSSVAHLAGSLGRPVWNLVQFVPYWIYGFEGERTPWYPSMRLLRQGRDEDWEPVFDRVHQDLAALAAAGRG